MKRNNRWKGPLLAFALAASAAAGLWVLASRGLWPFSIEIAGGAEEIAVQAGWGSVPAAGAGTGAATDIRFAPVSARSGARFGPKSFAPGAGGWTWVLDAGNGAIWGVRPQEVVRLPLADTQGRPVQGAELLAADAGGGLWVVDNLQGRLLFYPTSRGAQRAGREWPLGGVRVEDLSVTRDGQVYLTELQISPQQFQRRLRRLDAGGAHQRAAGQPLPEQILAFDRVTPSLPSEPVEGYLGFQLGADGRLYALRRAGGKLSVRALDGSGRPVREIALTDAGDGPGATPALLGVDRYGRIYLGQGLGSATGKITVWSGSEEQSAPVMRIAAPGGTGPAALTWARLGPDGSVYRLQSTQDQWVLTRHVLQPRPRLKL